MTPAPLVLDHVRITRPGEPAILGAAVVSGGRIAWIGAGEPPAGALRERALRIDCEGGALIPGFVDAHCHPLALGMALTAADCSPAVAQTIPQLQRQLADWAAAYPDARYVSGFGYDELLIGERRHPGRYDLDAAVPGRPVILTHGGGHAVVLNTAALRLIGITESTDEPAGGFIDREAETGTPSGLLFEMGGYVWNRLGRQSDAEVRRQASAASEAFIRAGVTSVVDAGQNGDLAQFQLWAGLRRDGTFRPGLTVMRAPGFRIPGGEAAELAEWMKPGPVKVFLIRGPHGFIPDLADLCVLVWSALRDRSPVAIHAVEAESILMACSAFEDAKGFSGARSTVDPARMRIEHAAEATPEVCAAIRRCGASVVTQPGFIYARGDRYLAAAAAGGCPVDDLYPLRRLLDEGIPVTIGSDAPYGPVSPLDAIYGAVVRTSASGRQVGRSQAVGTTEALALTFERSYPLRPGARADLTVLSDDPQAIAPERLRDVYVRLTVIGGEIAWQA
ncbi:MAG: amidohydrolase family protein [Chloroflexi bacterium]|nr:amidohydrolase family protein [Chloroflexota bacterium]